MRAWSWVRRVAAVVVLGCLVARFGLTPFDRGLHALDTRLLALATVLTAVATLCCAGRWRAVTTALGLALPLGPAFLACYRSQLLNTALPAGVLGDVDRAVLLGRRTGHRGLAARTVAWERGIGLVTQVGLTVVVLAVSASPVASSGVVVAVTALVVAAVAAVAAVVVALSVSRLGLRRMATAAATDARRLLATPRTGLAAVAGSVGVTACHGAVMAAAVRGTAGGIPLPQLLALALLIQLGAAVPTNVAGWGPREGVAAWAYAATGLDPAAGITASVACGAAATLALAPGALALLLGSATRWASALRGRPGERSHAG